MCQNHYYIYLLHEGEWVYERTCGIEQAAKDRVKYLKTLYEDAKYTINELLKEAFY